MSRVTPYKICVDESKLEHLKKKLALADFPDEIDDVGWARGAPLADLQRLTNYWRDGFDWRKAEEKLNELSHFSVDIPVEGFENLNIHFVHQRSKVETAIPLLFAHGWPGSFFEVTKIIEKLPESGDDFPAFHVVAPSLPNFGFSQGTRKKGFNVPQHAEVCHKLMLLLGYSEYVTQGGDLGFAVTRAMALQYPQSCKATHINMAILNEPTPEEFPALYAKMKATPLTDAEKAGIERGKRFQEEGSGYFKLQATKPQTIGYSMADSPVGLLAWIYEKLHDWSDGYRWKDDEILTWVGIYYFSTAGPAASQRIYYESVHDPKNSTAAYGKWIPDVKVGIGRFPQELSLPPKLWYQAMGPLVFEKEHDSGGHFAAFERPEALVEDLRTMFGKGGGAFGVVKKCTGYNGQ